MDGYGGSPMSKDAQATPSQFPPGKPKKLFYGCGGGNLDWGRDPRTGEDLEVVKGRRGTPSHRSLAEYGWPLVPG